MSEALRIPPGASIETYEQVARTRDWSVCCAGSEAAAVERRWQKRSNDIDAKLFLAREHGFAAWWDFAEHVRALVYVAAFLPAIAVLLGLLVYVGR